MNSAPVGNTSLRSACAEDRTCNAERCIPSMEDPVMRAEKKKSVYVRVRDGAGSVFLCPIEALKDLKEATDEELENCVDDAVVARYAGEVEVIES